MRCPLHGTLHSLVYRVMNLKNINGNAVLRPEQREVLFSKFLGKIIGGNEKKTTKKSKDKSLKKDKTKTKNEITSQPREEKHQMDEERPPITENETDKNHRPKSSEIKPKEKSDQA